MGILAQGIAFRQGIRENLIEITQYNFVMVEGVVLPNYQSVTLSGVFCREESLGN
jgi:hypothetical protein